MATIGNFTEGHVIADLIHIEINATGKGKIALMYPT